MVFIHRFPVLIPPERGRVLFLPVLQTGVTPARPALVFDTGSLAGVELDSWREVGRPPALTVVEEKAETEPGLFHSR